jgi:hypothetical protein
MRTLTGALLTIAGVILLAWAINDSDPMRSEVSKILDTVPGTKSFWLVAGGTISGILGLCLLSSRKTRG